MSSEPSLVPPRHHAEEARRLAHLARLGIMDTPPDERFDRLARLATLVLDSPMALVGFIDDHRQWFKANVGFGGTETPRDLTFCGHAIADDEMLVVEDATLDDRFRHNPFVTGDPNIRFYAGAVVHDPHGLPVGTVCVMDQAPRHLADDQRQALQDLAAMVEDELIRSQMTRAITTLEVSERGRGLVFDSLSEGLVVQDNNGHIVDWNPAAERLLGMSAGELGGLTALDPRWAAVDEDGNPLPGDDHPSSRTRRTGEPVVDEIMGVNRGDGETVWLKVNSRPIIDADGDVQGVLATFGDVTEALISRRELMRYGHLFRNSNDIITIVGRDGQVIYASPSNERVLGYPDGYRHAEGIIGLVHPDDMAEAATQLAALIDGTRGPEPFTVRVRSYTDEWRFVECVGVNLLDEPTVDGVVITARDTTEREVLAAEVAHRAAHDQLTDLPNRRVLEQRLSEALARGRRDHRSVGLCFVDLDGFKGVNDTLGHAAGDDLLVAVADALRDTLRGGDTPARVGGDEFVMVLDPILTEHDGLIAVRRVRNAIVALADGLPDGVPFGASFGLAVSEFGDGPDELIKRADAALYRAKARGGSAIELAPSALLPPVSTQP